jgi:hypothetical protein
MRSRLLRLGTSRAPVAAQGGGKGVWAISSARPDQLIRKADRIKGILTTDGTDEHG